MMPEGLHPSTHPPLPPTTEDERVSWLRLLRSRRVGISTFFRLMGEHGSAEAALDALPGVARAAGLDHYAPCSEEAARSEIARARETGAVLLCYGAPDYPSALYDLSDPPPLLWARGNTALLGAPAISMVGARNASSLGGRTARAFAAELSEKGHVIVSGLARGIDTSAHTAALEGGTIAVLAGGVDVIYPAENAHLAADIAAKGLILSEQPMGMSPQARHFPRRNRLISGLGAGLVVIEAAAKSGSLITARNALDQGREVLAVPGHPFDARASGCNMLIRDGATLVRSAADVLEALAPLATQEKAPELDLSTPGPASGEIPPPAPEKRSLRETAALHSRILDRLGPSPVPEDQLLRDLSASASDFTPALVELELEGRIARAPGGMVSRNDAGKAG